MGDKPCVTVLLVCWVLDHVPLAPGQHGNVWVAPAYSPWPAFFACLILGLAVFIVGGGFYRGALLIAPWLDPWKHRRHLGSRLLPARPVQLRRISRSTGRSAHLIMNLGNWWPPEHWLGIGFVMGAALRSLLPGHSTVIERNIAGEDSHRQERPESSSVLTFLDQTPQRRLAMATAHKEDNCDPAANGLARSPKLEMWLNDWYGDCVSAEEWRQLPAL